MDYTSKIQPLLLPCSFIYFFLYHLNQSSSLSSSTRLPFLNAQTMKTSSSGFGGKPYISLMCFAGFFFFFNIYLYFLFFIFGVKRVFLSRLYGLAAQLLFFNISNVNKINLSMLSLKVFEDIISIIKLLFGESKYHVQPSYF